MAKLIQQRWKRLGILGLFVLALAAPASAEEIRPAPDLGDCEELQPPQGSKVQFAAYAEGVQIYRWNGTSWTFVAPEAVLYAGDNDGGGVVGLHYGGPTWESNSGRKVQAAVLERCTPDPDAIPWLLLGAVSNEGPGIFRKVKFIQRLYTTGGLAPAETGDFVGEEARISYTAWYVFYR